MTATLSLNYECGRCPRVERKEITFKDAVEMAEKGLKAPPALRVVVDGEESVEIEHLCSVCREIVDGYLGNISKKLTQRSARREAAEVEVEIEA